MPVPFLCLGFFMLPGSSTDYRWEWLCFIYWCRTCGNVWTLHSQSSELSLTRWKLLNISRHLSSFSICVSLSYSVASMLHTIIDLEPGLLSWLVLLWQTLSIYIWSIGQSSDRPSCFQKLDSCHILLVKDPSLPTTFSNDCPRILIFFVILILHMNVTLHRSSFADHSKASENHVQCIFHSTWALCPWGSSSDIF